MSAIITGRVFWTDFSELSYKNKNGKKIVVKETTAKIVMLAIADSADDFGENSYQSFETIAKKTSIQRRSVMRVVRALVAHHYLKIAGISKYGTNTFSIENTKLGDAPRRRARIGRPKNGDSESKIGDSESETGDSESPDPSLIPPQEEEVTFADAWTFYQNNIKSTPTQFEAQAFGDLVDEHGPQWVIEAAKIAVKRSARSLAYITKILDRWKSEGYGTPFPGRNGRKPANDSAPPIPIVKAPESEPPVIALEKLQAARKEILGEK